jgi:peptide/nickel transport system ATP-binding protein
VNGEAALLEVENVSKNFYRTAFLRREVIRVLDGVSFEVQAGESLGLVGASGAGKSTLARIIAGLSRPDGGTVRIGGDDLYAAGGRRQSVRRRVHLVLQDPYDALAPYMRVRDLVAEPMRFIGKDELPSGDRRARLVDALDEVGLPIATYGERFPHQLSGGERQRVALARALVMRPSLIVADEPTSMVDFSVRRGILDLMERFRSKHGITLLYVTHDLALARQFCDRLLVLNQGAIVEDGPSDRVLDAPQDPYTQRLAAASRELALGNTATTLP